MRLGGARSFLGIMSCIAGVELVVPEKGLFGRRVIF
jgi:hypothetical protein